MTFLTSVLVGSVGGANAADLQDVYNSAMKNDVILGAAAAGLEARREAIPQARSALLPNLGAGASSSRISRSFPVGIVDTDPGSPTFGQEFGVPDQEFNDHGWQARLSQPLLDFESFYNWRSAKFVVEAAEADFLATEQAVIVRVAQAYLNVLRAQALLEASVAQEAAVQRQLEQVQQRFDVGLVAITDVLEAQAAYDGAVVTRVQAYGDHDIFFETLITLTGEAYAEIDGLSETLPIVNPEPANEEDWVNTALTTNLGIKAVTAQLESSTRNLRARRSGHLPTIDATVNHSHFVTGGSAFLGGKTDQTSYGVSINLPIYQGGFTHSRSKEASAIVDQSKQLLEDQIRTVRRDTRNLFRSVATDVVRVGARRKAITSTESALEATETGYEVGTRNIVDVLRAQQTLYSSQFDYADSRYNYVIDLLALKQAVGTLDPEDLAELNNFTDPTIPVVRQASLLSRSGNPGN
ncbi:MAG: TolC family outer membrane protein [Proteobacteria bacterium]|nr:TolC family outer membrane protein [Pseudomonadota bacterium]